MNSAPEDQRRRERGHGRQTPREPISITDRRRVDPVTGRVREHAAPSRTAAASRGAASSSQPRGGTSLAPPRTAAPGGASGAGASPESAQVDADRVAELTADLQRLRPSTPTTGAGSTGTGRRQRRTRKQRSPRNSSESSTTWTGLVNTGTPTANRCTVWTARSG